MSHSETVYRDAAPAMTLFGTAFFSRRSIPAWLVLIVGVLLTALLTLFMTEQRARSADQQFELHVKELVAEIEKRLLDHEQILLGGAGLFDVNGMVTRAQWRTYVDRLSLKQRYPGIQGVGFSQVIASDALQAHIAAMRAEGFSEYTVKPEGSRALYTSIIYLEPFKGRNLAAFGYDMYSNPVRRQAMQLAVNDNMTAISGKVRLVQETHGKEQAGFLMYVPIYNQAMPLSSAEQRWQALRGFVYSPYRMADLMRGILGGRDLVVGFALYDGASTQADTLMYDSTEHVQENQTSPSHRSNRRIHAYGHTWTLTLRSRPAFQAQFESPFDWMIPSLGVGISLSLFALVGSLLGRRERALKLADEMSARRAESEERFHQLFLHMGQGVLIHQSDGRIVDANPAAERILGLGLAQLRGARSLELPWKPIHEDGSDFTSDEHPANIVLRQGRPVKDVVMGVWHAATAGWRWIKMDAYSRNADPSNAEQRIYSVFSDITEQRAADLAVRQTQKFLSDVLAAASEVAIIATDCDGLITIFNKGAERLLGYSAEETVGKLTLAVLHKPDEVMARASELSIELGRSIEGFRVFVEKPERDGSETREWTYVHKHGQHIPVSLVVTTMRDDAGQVVGYLGIAEDITERKQAETALMEQAQHTQAILDNIVDGIITINEDGIIQSFNPAAKRIFGYADDEVLGRNVNMLMPSPHREAHDGYLRNYQSTGVARIIGIGREVEGLRKGGSLFPMELAVSEITQHGQPQYVGMVRDITERKRMERMKSEFVSTVSHELRTPLTSISGALGLVTGGGLGELSPQAAQMIGIAHKNSQRLTHLINDLLDMEKIAAGKLHFEMQMQPLLPLIRQALESHQVYGAEQQVELILDAVSEVEVKVDSERLQQVLANLLSNAIKFSPEGGKVRTLVQPLPGKVRVTVSDHGPGIPEAFRARIFEKFSQADSSDTRQKGGTGLGLAITRELIERMDGAVGFDSVEGEGASFWFELPLIDHSQFETAASDTSPALSSAPRILVVEDEPDVAEVLAALLSRNGYRVDVAHTGQQALSMLEDTVYDALSLDLMLPDISGLEVILQLRQQAHTVDLPIMVLSAKMEAGKLAINGNFPFIEWLAKPIDEQRLLETIEGLLGATKSMPSRVLHVEDDADLHQVIRSMAGSRFDFELVTSLREARERLALERFDVILIDISLPDGSGWDLLPEIRSRQPDARVLILSGSEMTADETRKVEAVLLKSQVSPRELLDALSRRIQHQTRRK